MHACRSPKPELLNVLLSSIGSLTPSHVENGLQNGVAHANGAVPKAAGSGLPNGKLVNGHVSLPNGHASSSPESQVIPHPQFHVQIQSFPTPVHINKEYHVCAGASAKDCICIFSPSGFMRFTSRHGHLRAISPWEMTRNGGMIGASCLSSSHDRVRVSLKQGEKLRKLLASGEASSEAYFEPRHVSDVLQDFSAAKPDLLKVRMLSLTWHACRILLVSMDAQLLLPLDTMKSGMCHHTWLHLLYHKGMAYA